MPDLLGGTSDKLIRCPCRLTHNIQRGEIQTLMLQSEGLKVLSISKASCVDWQAGFTSVPSQQLWWAEGQSLQFSAYLSMMLLGQAWASSVWGVQLIWSLQDGILMLHLRLINNTHVWRFCGFGYSSLILRASLWCASWHHFHGFHGIYFIKSKKSTCLYARYNILNY